MHFLIMIWEPTSSYSALVIHWFLNVVKLASTDPPIQTDYFLSFCAITLTFMVLATSLLTSASSLWSIPGYMLEPPDRIRFSYCCFLASMSTLSMDVWTKSWIDLYSRLMVRVWPSLGLNMHSGHWNSSLPNWMIFSSGSLTSTLFFLPLS